MTIQVTPIVHEITVGETTQVQLVLDVPSEIQIIEAGQRGPVGPQGETGPQGIQGATGDDGREVELQNTGTWVQWRYVGDVTWINLVEIADLQGPQGETGPQGTQGIQGIQGPQGDTGPQGIQGEIGPQGTQGIQGIQGPQGDTGPQGIQGEIGPQGTQGIQGVQGLQGPQGDTGPQGIQGEAGPQGTQGIQGAAGDDGREVELQNTGTWVQWRYVGEVTWTNLIEVADLQGPQGDAGPQGAQGIQGIQGPQGDAGPQGAQGIQGIQGPQGDTGPQGIQGIQGPQGDTGPQGIQGIQGPPGVTDIAWDDVTDKPTTFTPSTHAHTASDISDFSTAADARIAAADLDDLAGVVISTPSTGQVLKYNGANWINDTDATGAGGGAPTDASYVTVAANSTLTNERILTAGKNISLNDGGAGSPITLSSPISSLVVTSISHSPTGDQDDYSPSNWNGSEPSQATVLRINPNTSIRITGLAGGTEGRCATLRNISTFLIILCHETSASSSANQFSFADRMPRFLMPGDSIELVYSDSFWRARQPGHWLASFFEICDGFGTGPFTAVVNGTGASGQAGTYLVTNTTQKPLGVWQVDSGTTNAGRAYWGAQNNSIVPGQGSALYLVRLAVEALSTSGERFQIRAGYHDGSAAAAVVDGVYWQYDEAASALWQICTAAASSRTETPVTGLTVDTNYIYLGIFIVGDWSSAQFFWSQNPTTWQLAGSINGNMPGAAVSMGAGITKSVGTTQRNLAIDLQGWRYDVLRGV